MEIIPIIAILAGVSYVSYCLGQYETIKRFRPHKELIKQFNSMKKGDCIIITDKDQFRTKFYIERVKKKIR